MNKPLNLDSHMNLLETLESWVILQAQHIFMVMGMLYNLKFFQLKLHFKVSFIYSKNNTAKFSTRNELFINSDNGISAQPRSYNISIKISLCHINC